MFNLADILAQMQGNQDFQALARQFGMAPDQVQKAMEALLPAFTLGLNRATQSPADMAGLFGLFAGGPNYAQLFEQPMANLPAMMAAGQEVMTKLFGSGPLAQAIASQAASATGLGQEVMKQVMPVMASLIMGGLMKSVLAGENPLGEMMSAILRQMAPGFAKPMPQVPPQGAPADPMGQMMGLFANALGGMMGTRPQPQAGTAQAVPDVERFMELVRQIQAANPLFGGAGTPEPAKAPEAEATGPRTLGQQAADTWTATMGRLFEHGRDIQDQQLTQIEKLFEEFAPKKTG